MASGDTRIKKNGQTSLVATFFRLSTGICEEVCIDVAAQIGRVPTDSHFTD